MSANGADVEAYYPGTLRSPNDTIDTPLGSFEVRYLEVNLGMLGRDLQHQAPMAGWVGEYENTAQTHKENLEQELNERSSDLWEMIVARPVPEGQKAPTVKAIENEIERDPEIRRLRRDLITANHAYRQFCNIRKAIDAKGRMIQSFVGLERSKIEIELQSSRAAVSDRMSSQQEGKVHD